MCGIAGIFHYGNLTQNVDPAVLLRMTRLLAHRGPDGEGFFVDGPLGLGHRRLAVVDPSPAGAQPMVSPDRRFSLTYNGEIYNHGKYRSALGASGQRFVGTSDTETLLGLLIHQGPRVLSELAGIFAFGFYDGKHRRLILARDPLGVKPLYYHDNGQRIVFASEIKALLACPDVPRSLDTQAVNEYLHFHTPVFERTFFRDIQQLRPAEILQVSPQGCANHVYWHLGTENLHYSPEVAVDALDELLKTVVSEQLRSDVPVGAYFSGGLDSSTIAAVARAQGTALRCFGAHFSNTDVIDELPYQKAVAQSLGLQLESATVHARSVPDDLKRLLYYQDQPVVGPSMLPMFYISRLASQQVKVCLGGQGADEIFGGYARYALAAPLVALQRGQSAAGDLSQTPGRGSLLKQLGSVRNLRRLAASLGHVNAESRYFAHFVHVPELAWRTLAADSSWLSRSRVHGIFDDFVRHSAAQQTGNKLLHWDMRTYLTGLFQQEDRMSMANGVESRMPLADPRLVQFCFGLNFNLKIRHGSTKWLLRKVVNEALPKCVLSRRKVGFDTPAPAWLRGPGKAFVHDILLSRSSRERGLWQPKALQKWVSNDRHPLWFDVVWKLLCIEAWAQVFLDDGWSLQRDPPLMLSA